MVQIVVVVVVEMVVVVLEDASVCVELTRNEILDFVVVTPKEQWKKKTKKEQNVEA